MDVAATRLAEILTEILVENSERNQVSNLNENDQSLNRKLPSDSSASIDTSKMC
jgi:hypothetical protein